jgi:hypothetical protein
MTKIRFFSNGNVMAFSERGEQMPEIQGQSWLLLYIKWLESRGCEMETTELYTPDGRYIKLIANDAGEYVNWEIL